MHEVTQLIAGQWSTGGSGRELTVVNPADGEAVTRVAVAADEEVAEAVRAARAAAPSWARTSPGARGAAPSTRVG